MANAGEPAYRAVGWTISASGPTGDCQTLLASIQLAVAFRDVPTYVYKFLETGETIEVQQSFDDPTLTEATHPVTGITMAVKKVFLPVGVTFKGDGFYKTDSRTSAKSNSSSASSADAAGSSAPDAATTSNAAGGPSSTGPSSSASPAAGPPASSTSSSD